MSVTIRIGVLAVILGLGVIGFASAQENSTTKPMIHYNTRAVTGCLQKGDDEYVLLADDGGTWELKGNSVKLDGEIGHTVVITGIVSDPEMHATKGNTNDKQKERRGYGYINVSKLTLVSNTCERNS
jgi:hypothetical protein